MSTPLKFGPLRLEGPWTEGYALDFHTASSTYVGDDEFGHPVFKTDRTPLGEALYRLKYRQDKSQMQPIAATVGQFLNSRDWKVDAIVPVPPSTPRRRVQPVQEIANELGRLIGVPVCSCVTKAKATRQLKNVYDRAEREHILHDAFVADPGQTRGLRLLLLDDLYRSGATAASATKVLLDAGEAAAVYFIAVTRTRKHG
ncbi:MAG: hypothetical protein N2036_14875 [Bryobacteraceae bacterium]|nr:hypothetical protein [Bryobacteraceae bacterium]